MILFVDFEWDNKEIAGSRDWIIYRSKPLNSRAFTCTIVSPISIHPNSPERGKREKRWLEELHRNRFHIPIQKQPYPPWYWLCHCTSLAYPQTTWQNSLPFPINTGLRLIHSFIYPSVSPYYFSTFFRFQPQQGNCFSPSRRDMVENGKKHRQNSHLINHCPTSEKSEQANEWEQRRARAKRAMRSKRMSERYKRTDERVAQYCSLYFWLF